MKTNPKSLLLYCIPLTLVDSNAVKLFCCCVVAKLCPALSVKTYGLKPARLLCPAERKVEEMPLISEPELEREGICLFCAVTFISTC